MVARGDVCWFEGPVEGRRPVCVLTRDAALPVLTYACVAFVTRTVRGIPTEVELGPEDGMRERCAVVLDNLRTVPHSMLTERITSLSGIRMHEVCVALRRATGC